MSQPSECSARKKIKTHDFLVGSLASGWVSRCPLCVRFCGTHWYVTCYVISWINYFCNPDHLVLFLPLQASMMSSAVLANVTGCVPSFFPFYSPGVAIFFLKLSNLLMHLKEIPLCWKQNQTFHGFNTKELDFFFSSAPCQY